MKKFAFACLVLLSGIASAQDKKVVPPPDTLQGFKFQLKNEPFPFDSGVAVSYSQYDYSFKKDVTQKVDSKYENSDKQKVKIVYVPAEEKKGLRGWVWVAIGGILGTALGLSL